MTDADVPAPPSITGEQRQRAGGPIERVLVTGAAGFLGTQVCTTLIEHGYRVTGLVRRLPKTVDRIEGLDYEVGDVTDRSSLAPGIFAAADAVVHLVGIIVELRGIGQTFAAVHVRGTENVVQAASGAGAIQKIVYVSALGASPASKSEYSRTKASAEAVIEKSELKFTILRPSIILGRSGDFVHQIEGLIKRPPLSPFRLPFIPVPGTGKNLFQPIYIDDLTEIIVRSLSQPESDHHTYEIGGEDQVTFNALISAFCKKLHIEKPLLHIPTAMLFVAASILEALLPKPPLTVDQLINLREDSVCDNTNAVQTFRVTLRSFDQALEEIYGPNASA